MTEPVIDLLSEVWSAISHLGAGLDADGWHQPTDCPGWSVRDIVAHLVGMELLVIAGVEPETPSGARAPHVRNDFGAVNEAFVAERRDRPVGAVLAEFDDLTATRLRELHELAPEAWDAEVWTPIGRSTYRGFMDTRLFDSWVHEQDIRRAVSQPGGWDTPAADRALEVVASAMAFVVGRKAQAPAGSRVIFDVSPPWPRTVAVEVGERARRVTELSGPPTVRLRLDAETFLCLGAGRWDGDAVLAEGRVDIEGDEDLGQRIVESMAFLI